MRRLNLFRRDRNALRTTVKRDDRKIKKKGQARTRCSRCPLSIPILIHRYDYRTSIPSRITIDCFADDLRTFKRWSYYLKGQWSVILRARRKILCGLRSHCVHPVVCHLRPTPQRIVWGTSLKDPLSRDLLLLSSSLIMPRCTYMPLALLTFQ